MVTAVPNLAYVGTYTRSGRSGGIHAFDHDAAAGTLTPLGITELADPSFLAFDPTRRFLFAVSEGEGRDGGAVASFRIDPQSGALTQLSHQPTGGGEPCHLCTDLSGKWLIVANHEHGSVAVLPIDAEGRLGPMTELRQHEGSGPGPTQTGPHAHFVTFDPTGERLLVCDKGIDQVVSYRLRDGHLEPANPPFGRLHAGAAPRHLSFHPNGRFAYVNGEADMTITAFSYTDGTFEELQVLPTVPEDADRTGFSTAQILVEPSGRFVYVSNRGHDSIAAFAINPATGLLSSLGTVPTQGRTPRNFTFDPAGKRAYVANQGSDTVVPFSIAADGQLQQTGEVTAVGAPVCVLFR
jgi:6-phosphogluconolactonase